MKACKWILELRFQTKMCCLGAECLLNIRLGFLFLLCAFSLSLSLTLSLWKLVWSGNKFQNEQLINIGDLLPPNAPNMPFPRYTRCRAILRLLLSMRAFWFSSFASCSLPTSCLQRSFVLKHHMPFKYWCHMGWLDHVPNSQSAYWNTEIVFLGFAFVQTTVSLQILASTYAEKQTWWPSHLERYNHWLALLLVTHILNEQFSGSHMGSENKLQWRAEGLGYLGWFLRCHLDVTGPWPITPPLRDSASLFGTWH